MSSPSKPQSSEQPSTLADRLGSLAQRAWQEAAHLPLPLTEVSRTVRRLLQVRGEAGTEDPRYMLRCADFSDERSEFYGKVARMMQRFLGGEHADRWNTSGYLYELQNPSKTHELTYEQAMDATAARIVQILKDAGYSENGFVYEPALHTVHRYTRRTDDGTFRRDVAERISTVFKFNDLESWAQTESASEMMRNPS